MIIEEFLPVLSHKQPKVIAASLSALNAIFHAYGVQIVDPKPVLKALPKVFGHADKNVRAEASSLVVELYRWLRDAMKKFFWDELKPVQQQDIDKLCQAASSDPPPKQERLLRSQQAAAAAAARAGDEAEDEEVADPQEAAAASVLAEIVDVYKKVPSDFHENVSSSKWAERKGALDGLLAVAKEDQIQEGPFDEIIQALAKCMKDSNISVVISAANCVEALARGLRKGFSKYRNRILTPMLERLKEKKQSVTDALGAALDAVFASSSLTDCLTEIVEFLGNKNPQVKLETLRFLTRCLRTTRDAPSKTETKSIADIVTKLLADTQEVTRSVAAEALGTLMKIMGEKAMAPYLEGIDDIKKAKIKESFDNAQVKAKNKPKPAAPPPQVAPPTQRKTTKKLAAGLKKATPQAPTPEVEKPPPPASLQPKPTSGKNIPSKINGPSSGLKAPSGGLGLQKKLAAPKGLPSQNVSSPKRNVVSPTYEEESAPAPKLGLGGRGLAGRPLGKPISAPSEPAPPPAPAGMSAVERAELEEVRGERDRLQKASEDLRSDKSKLASQINELQNQNAQLIEDHTRDVLSIKAKETQLVRARSDAESAEQTVQKQQREIERLKRELSRAVRASSPPPADLRDQIYHDTAMNGNAHGSHSSIDKYNNGMSSREIGYQRARNYMTSPSEEKENASLETGGTHKTIGSPPSGSFNSRTLSSEGRSERDALPAARGKGVPGGDVVTNGDGEPIESWKRAAEVTSQLKARIEQMKVSLLTRFHPF